MKSNNRVCTCKAPISGIGNRESIMPISRFYELFGKECISKPAIVRGADLVALVKNINNSNSKI